MRGARVIGLVLAAVALVVGLFAAATAWLPAAAWEQRSWEAMPPTLLALSAVCLLCLDFVLPVPSTAMLAALGATLGGPTGALVGALALTVSSAAGFASGYLGRHQADRWLRSDAGILQGLVRRHGLAAVVLTRPVPVAAETVSALCGVAAMDLRLFLVGSLLGNVAVATAFSFAGASATSLGTAGWAAVFVAGALACGTWWAVSRRVASA